MDIAGRWVDGITTLRIILPHLFLQHGNIEVTGPTVEFVDPWSTPQDVVVADGTTELQLTPLELIDRIAALVPPPRVHRHRYHGVLAPNSPLRDQVTALIPETVTDKPVLASGCDATDAPDQVSHSPARYLWTTLIARLLEVLLSLHLDLS